MGWVLVKGEVVVSSLGMAAITKSTDDCGKDDGCGHVAVDFGGITKRKGQGAQSCRTSDRE